MYLKPVTEIDLAEVKLNMMEDFKCTHYGMAFPTQDRNREMTSLTFPSLSGLSLNRDIDETEEEKIDISNEFQKPNIVQFDLDNKIAKITTSKISDEDSTDDFHIDFPLNYNNILYKAVARIQERG